MHPNRRYDVIILYFVLECICLISLHRTPSRWISSCHSCATRQDLHLQSDPSSPSCGSTMCTMNMATLPCKRVSSPLDWAMPFCFSHFSCSSETRRRLSLHDGHCKPSTLEKRLQANLSVQGFTMECSCLA